MKKIYSYILLFLCIFIVGCSNQPQTNAYEYEVDLSLITEDILIDNFDVSLIRIKQTDKKGNVIYINCNESMFTVEDYKLFERVGTHEVTVKYKTFEDTFTITLKNESFIENYDQDLKVYFINVGQADCILIILPTNETVLIDAGLDHATCFGENNFPSWDNIVTVFELENIEIINHFIITHNHSDHYNYAVDIMKQYTVKNIYMSGSSSTNYMYINILTSIGKYDVKAHTVSVGDKIINENKLLLEVVSTQKIDNPSDANICSVCTKLTYGNNSFLFMGDAGTNENDGEEIALNSGIDLKSDVLKVGHHGSAYASGRNFLSKVKPTYAVITSASFTTTGHPHKSAMDRLKMYSDYIYQSKIDGTILFTSDGNTLTVTKHIGE